MTSRSLGYVDLVHTYLPFQYGDDQRSLRSSNAHFKVWPLTPNIWPWGQKFKIPPYSVFAYGPKEHSYAFIALSYQNCRRSSRKYEKMAKNDQFITRTSWAENRSTTKHMPGWHFFQDASTIAISWWSDIDKVVKRVWQTDIWKFEWFNTQRMLDLSFFFVFSGVLLCTFREFHIPLSGNPYFE